MQHQDYTLFFVRIVIVSEVCHKLEPVITPKLVLIEEHYEIPKSKTNQLVNSHMLRGKIKGNHSIFLINFIYFCIITNNSHILRTVRGKENIYLASVLCQSKSAALHDQLIPHELICIVSALLLLLRKVRVNH